MSAHESEWHGNALTVAGDSSGDSSGSGYPGGCVVMLSAPRILKCLLQD